MDQIVEFAGFSGYKVSISVSDESNFFTNGDGNFVFKRGTEPVITVTASTPGIPFPEGHLFCDDCGKLGPKKGKQDRICFWLCEECMSGFKE